MAENDESEILEEIVSEKPKSIKPKLLTSRTFAGRRI